MRLSSERSAYSWKPARTLVRSIRKPIPRTSLCLLAFYGGSPRQRQEKSGCDGYSLCASRGLELKISQSSSLLVSQRPVPVNQTCEVRTFPTATDPHRKDSFCLKRLGRSRSYQSFIPLACGSVRGRHTSLASLSCSDVYRVRERGHCRKAAWRRSQMERSADDGTRTSASQASKGHRCTVRNERHTNRSIRSASSRLAWSIMRHSCVSSQAALQTDARRSQMREYPEVSAA